MGLPEGERSRGRAGSNEVAYIEEQERLNALHPTDDDGEDCGQHDCGEDTCVCGEGYD